MIFSPRVSIVVRKDLPTRVAPELMDRAGPSMTAAKLDTFLDPNDDEAMHVLGKLNVFKHWIY